MQIAISQTIKNEVKDYFYITLGLLIYTFGWTIFLLPYQIVTGGVTGIAAVIYYGTGIPIYLSYFLINAALLLAALKILGFKFMVKTIYAIIMLSVFLALAQDWMIGENGKMVQVLGWPARLLHRRLQRQLRVDHHRPAAAQGFHPHAA